MFLFFFLLYFGELWRLLDEAVDQKRRSYNATADAIVEVERYLAEVNLRRHEDPWSTSIHKNMCIPTCTTWHRGSYVHQHPQCLARACFPRLGRSSADKEIAFNHKQ
ncbi:hypothetical protein ILYODFUR_039233 [Ilyodon furcidens]|uniref:Uncharacterized protein n=1 Tax=Ilyodon furcidens TaxID=33524 RepID=A0ABV0TGM5_9TELE